MNSDSFYHFDSCSLSGPLSISLSCVNRLYDFCKGIHFLCWQNKNSLLKECRGNRIFILFPLLFFFFFFMLIASQWSHSSQQVPDTLIVWTQWKLAGEQIWLSLLFYFLPWPGDLETTKAYGREIHMSALGKIPILLSTAGER